MAPKNPLNDSDVDGNTMAWMADREPGGPNKCGRCGEYLEDCCCEDSDNNED